MGCPHVLGDKPRDLASGLSTVQLDNHGITYLNVEIAHYVIFRMYCIQRDIVSVSLRKSYVH